MKLLDAIKNITEMDNETLDYVIYSLECRRDDVEIREPLSDGSVYDKWEEKLSDLDDIIEELKYAKDIKDREEKEKALKDVKNSIDMHQIFYGGLKRLKV